MKKQTLSFLFIIGAIQLANAQKAPAITIEKWAERPVLHQLESKYTSEPAVVITDVRRLEYIDAEKQELAAYYTTHKLVHINDDRGIERFNKIYLSVNEDANMIDVKARTILPGGRVLELNKSNIKEIKEKDDVYKIFAMEGLEKGCEVEYTYTFKRPLSFMGREVVQTDMPQMGTTFEVISPERLRFELKPYNFTGASVDTVLNGKRISRFLVKDAPAAEEEKYADYAANLRRIEFRLSYNDDTRKGERLFTWNELARRVYGSYTDYSEKENAQVLAMIKANGWDKLTNEAAKVIAVEDFIKKKYAYNEDMNEDAPNRVDVVLKNKVAGTHGTMRLYTAILQNLDVKYQYVLAADRSKMQIDRTFENWNNCDYPLLYFPTMGKYIAPSRPDLRYPWIVPAWGDANGLFFRRTSLGSVTTALADVRPIALEDYTKSMNNINSRLELNTGLDSIAVDTRLTYGGYTAVTYRDAFNFANEDQKRNMIKEMAKAMANSENVLFSEVLDPEFDKATKDIPITLHIKTKSGELIERAGNKLLVKIGLAIGTQVQMYQEKPRQSPINLDFGNVQERKIDLVIPAGYKVSNPDDLKLSQVYTENGEQSMGFTSSYKLNGNVLSVHIVEDYRKTQYPITVFDQFKKIINTSADFNKVVLVLEKI